VKPLSYKLLERTNSVVKIILSHQNSAQTCTASCSLAKAPITSQHSSFHCQAPWYCARHPLALHFLSRIGFALSSFIPFTGGATLLNQVFSFYPLRCSQHYSCLSLQPCHTSLFSSCANPGCWGLILAFHRATLLALFSCFVAHVVKIRPCLRGILRFRRNMA
jgi:hypothetical protein